MKKSLIAAAGASLAAAAFPVVGVFAATTTTSFTDEVKVNIGTSCTIIPEDGTVVKSDTTDTGGNRTVVLEDREFGPYELMQGHYISNIGGDQIAEDTDDPADADVSDAPSAATIVCSNGAGNVAPGSDDPTTIANNSWILTAVAADGTAMTSAGSATIPTGAWEGVASVWQYKVIGSDTATNYAAVPGTASVIASSKTSGGSVTISPRYRVRAAADQAEGTYTGKVTYTLTYAAE